MSARGKARRRAVDILYEAEIRGVEIPVILEQTRQRLALHSAVPLNPLVDHLVLGVMAHRAEIDTLINEHSVGWSADRMPTLDLAILRVGCFELLHDAQTPKAVVIAEAVKLASSLSTEESGAFVNGVLAAVARTDQSIGTDGPTG